MLSVEDVSAGYGRLEILHKVSLEVAPGEIVGIIGPNGAGKSTLLKTIFGYLPPFEGSVRFEGAMLAGQSPDRIMRRGIGYVAQAGGIFADMTVHENLVLGGYSLGSSRAAARSIEKIYDQFPRFRERARQRAGSMSGGEQRALAVARTLVIEPRLIILDEPSAALSPRFIDEIYGTLADLNKSGIALLIVEQNVRRILDSAHRVVVLDMGRNAFAGASEELRQSDRIRKLYLGEDAG
ncbi:neutral amino acid ABC transporter ATP-binding protein [Enhydrobacter aerosaccus]|uniref:Neutral amino acid ABC transporter ATP-binding protein n=1 Tax=Enhydrobacter aerosaccus TaxID=225324 RepID=A0A1T4PVI0_9HYPH|nr:ABC transporter ATP-binding protein [Enhydrobacter aerosaccus]SJZ95366.1 neutral amino acid ABC transporter ATP-binding protein [Enhydrobacter aerosaccus]